MRAVGGFDLPLTTAARSFQIRDFHRLRVMAPLKRRSQQQLGAFRSETRAGWPANTWALTSQQQLGAFRSET